MQASLFLYGNGKCISLYYISFIENKLTVNAIARAKMVANATETATAISATAVTTITTANAKVVAIAITTS